MSNLLERMRKDRDSSRPGVARYGAAAAPGRSKSGGLAAMRAKMTAGSSGGGRGGPKRAKSGGLSAMLSGAAVARGNAGASGRGGVAPVVNSLFRGGAQQLGDEEEEGPDLVSSNNNAAVPPPPRRQLGVTMQNMLQRKKSEIMLETQFENMEDSLNESGNFSFTEDKETKTDVDSEPQPPTSRKPLGAAMQSLLQRRKSDLMIGTAQGQLSEFQAMEDSMTSFQLEDDKAKPSFQMIKKNGANVQSHIDTSTTNTKIFEASFGDLAAQAPARRASIEEDDATFAKNVFEVQNSIGPEAFESSTSNAFLYAGDAKGQGFDEKSPFSPIPSKDSKEKSKIKLKGASNDELASAFDSSDVFASNENDKWLQEEELHPSSPENALTNTAAFEASLSAFSSSPTKNDGSTNNKLAFQSSATSLGESAMFHNSTDTFQALETSFPRPPDESIAQFDPSKLAAAVANSEN